MAAPIARPDRRRALEAVRSAFARPEVRREFEEWRAERAEAGKQCARSPLKTPA